MTRPSPPEPTGELQRWDKIEIGKKNNKINKLQLHYAIEDMECCKIICIWLSIHSIHTFLKDSIRRKDNYWNDTSSNIRNWYTEVLQTGNEVVINIVGLKIQQTEGHRRHGMWVCDSVLWWKLGCVFLCLEKCGVKWMKKKNGCKCQRCVIYILKWIINIMYLLSYHDGTVR